MESFHAFFFPLVFSFSFLDLGISIYGCVNSDVSQCLFDAQQDEGLTDLLSRGANQSL